MKVVVDHFDPTDWWKFYFMWKNGVIIWGENQEISVVNNTFIW